MRIFVAKGCAADFEAGKAAKLSSAGAQVGKFTTLCQTPDGGTLSPFPPRRLWLLDLGDFSTLLFTSPVQIPGYATTRHFATHPSKKVCICHWSA